MLCGIRGCVHILERNDELVRRSHQYSSRKVFFSQSMYPEKNLLSML
jgi:hypothetical protein